MRKRRRGVRRLGLAGKGQLRDDGLETSVMRKRRRGVRRLSLAGKGQLRDDSLEDISDEEEEEGSQEAQFSR